MKTKKPVENIAEDLLPLAVDIDTIKLDPNNARDHGEESLSVIAASLRNYSQRKPVVVNKRTGFIEAGNGTYQAALSLGWERIAAVMVDDDPDQAMGFALVDNRTAEKSKWKPQETQDQIAAMNFPDIDIAKLMIDLSKDMDKILAEANQAQPAEVAPPPEPIPEMELVPYEHYDYILVLCKNLADWNYLNAAFGLKRESSPFAKNKIGLGRAIWGGSVVKLLEKLKNAGANENSGSDTQAGEELGDHSKNAP